MRLFSTTPRTPIHYNEQPEMPSRTARTPMTGTPTEQRGNCRGTRPNPTDENALLLLIQRLGFAKVELELYLDAYPECTSALQYYREVVDNLNMAMAQYQEKYGPLTADESRGDTWMWVKGKWPWQLDEWR